MWLRAEREGKDPVKLTRNNLSKLTNRGFAFEITIRTEDLPASLNNDPGALASYPQRRYVGDRWTGYAIQGFIISQDTLFAVSPNDPFRATEAAFIPYSHVPESGIKAKLRRVPITTNHNNKNKDYEDLGEVTLFAIKN